MTKKNKKPLDNLNTNKKLFKIMFSLIKVEIKSQNNM